MIEFVKQTDRVDAIGPDGTPVAYIEKNYMGTHGHSRGWEHFIYDKQYGFIYAGAIQVDHLNHPWIFSSVKDFKNYYGGN